MNGTGYSVAMFTLKILGLIISALWLIVIALDLIEDYRAKGRQ